MNATVTGCVGLASGTGVTQSGFRCTATFVLDGHRYTDLLGGSNGLRAAGDTVPAVADPAEPGHLSTATSVKATGSSWTAFIAPAIALALLVLVVGLALWRSRRQLSR